MTMTLRSGTEIGPPTRTPTPEREDIGNRDNQTDPQAHSSSNHQEHTGGALAGLLGIAEMTQQIARHCDRDTTIRFAQATTAIRTALGPENTAAVFERNASTIRTGQAFYGAFERLLGIAEKFRDGPLCVLGARIPKLPEDQQQAALDAWLPVAQQQRNRSALLNDLVLATAEGPAGMSEVPTRAVERGENVQAVAQLFGITEDLETLELSSVHGPAGAAVRAGENVQAVVQRFGITGPAFLVTLRRMAREVEG